MVALAFDGTITIGNLIETAAVVSAGFMALSRLIGGVRAVDERVKAVAAASSANHAAADLRFGRLETEMAKQTEILVALGKQDVRIGTLEAQVAAMQPRLVKDA